MHLHAWMGGIHTEIGAQTIQGRHTGPHHGMVALAPGDLNGTMGGKNKNTGMAVVNRHYFFALTKRE